MSVAAPILNNSDVNNLKTAKQDVIEIVKPVEVERSVHNETKGVNRIIVRASKLRGQRRSPTRLRSTSLAIVQVLACVSS